MGSRADDRPETEEEQDAPREPQRDHPGKPFRTPNKTKTHAAPEVATDGFKPWPEQDEPVKK
jgi:hypothetical protein